MSAWRRKARELLPDTVRMLNRAYGLPDLLHVLLADVRAGYEATPPDTARIERTYAFVRWCLEGNQNSARRHTVIERFVLHLGAIPAARTDIPRLIGKATFKRSRAIFEAGLEPPDYEATLAAFVAHELAGPPTAWTDA
jgi:hypothetical protein